MNNLLMEKLKVASEYLSLRDGSGNHIVSSKWVINNILQGKQEYRKAKIKKITNG